MIDEEQEGLNVKMKLRHYTKLLYHPMKWMSRDEVSKMYKHLLGKAEAEGEISCVRKLLHQLYQLDSSLPDPRPLFKAEVESDWYAPTTDESKLCVIEVNLATS